MMTDALSGLSRPHAIAADRLRRGSSRGDCLLFNCLLHNMTSIYTIAIPLIEVRLESSTSLQKGPHSSESAMTWSPSTMNPHIQVHVISCDDSVVIRSALTFYDVIYIPIQRINPRISR